MKARRRGKGEKGIAIIMTGLVLLPLMVFAAFGVDLASWYSRISYLQKSADAAALAGTVWMPNLGRSSTEANASLQANGIVDGVDGIVVQIERGATATSLRVIVTDTDADRIFSGVFRGAQELTRSAEAEYNLPIPLGSPLNYFGGDAARTAPAPSFSDAVTWPTDYTTRVPVNRNPAGCNMGSASSQGLGTWPSTGGFDAGGYTTGAPQCLFGSSGAVTSGTSLVPPADHSTRVPTNGVNSTGCRVREDGTGSYIERWRNSTFTVPSGGSAAACSWPNWATTASSIPPDADTRLPTNQPCRVGLATTGAAGGFWNGSYFATPSALAIGGSAANGNRLCTWAVGITTTDTTPPNPISLTRSPGFWAAIEGPQTRAYQGDAYSTRCYTSTSCTSDQNAMYLQPSNADRGFWYVVKIPAGLSGSVALNVFDASYVTGGATSDGAGDRSLDGGGTFPTAFRVYEQDNPLDFSLRTPIGSGTANTSDGSCNWSLGTQVAFQRTWRNLCNLTVSPGETYLINVQTTGASGAGVNGYALEAVAGNNHANIPQPALYAYSTMAMQNNNFCVGVGCTPAPATFYLAEVGPQYAGRTLVMELWDSGDVGSGVTATMSPMRPSPNPGTPRPVVNVPAAECSFTADANPNARISGVTGTEYTTAQPSDDPTICSIRSSVSGASRFNGEWLRIRIDIPATYTCTLDTNPETTGGSCWWGIQYVFTGSANDVTTWSARIEGNPVHLTE